MNFSNLKKNRYLVGLGIIFCFLGALHLTFVGLFSDDEWFFDMIAGAGSIGTLLIERYNTWTSRLLTEAACFWLVESPFWIWDVLDTMIGLLLYHSVSVILVNDKDSKKNIYIALVMAVYPFMHMASAGWISTTLNYLWPFSLGLYALTGAVRRIRGEKLPWYKYLLYILCLIFAINCELSTAYVFLVFIGAIVYKSFFVVSKNADEKNGIKVKDNIYEIVAILLSIGGMIFAFTCPGNAVRNEIEIRWMPEFPDLNIFEKFRLCAVFVFEHFIAIPDVLFFMFSLFLAFIGFKKTNKLWKNIVALLPVTIDVVYTGVYFVNDFIIGHKRSYDFSFPAIYMTNAKITFIQMSELIGLLVFIAATIFIIVDSFRDTKDKFIAIWSLGSGFAVRMSLMLSATMFVSWHRTLIYFYYGMIVAIVMMLEYLDKDKKWQVHACRFLIVCGVIINVFLTVGHQLRLG